LTNKRKSRNREIKSPKNNEEDSAISPKWEISKKVFETSKGKAFISYLEKILS
jgi:hypothetical protein